MALKQAFARILLAIDGSDASMRAADYAARIAKDQGAQLAALLVVPPPSFSVPGELADYVDARKNAHVLMNQVETIAAQHDIGVKTEILVAALTVLDGILGYAQTMPADLIVTGRRGSASSRRRLVGSVSSGLVEYGECAVLVVR